MDKIMICYDGSPTARVVVEKTVDLYKETKPDINIVLVVDNSGAVGHEEDQYWKNCNETVEKRAQWVKEQGYEVESHVYSGHPREKVLEAVEELKPNVVVVGRMGDTHAQQLLHRTIHDALIKHSPCPVLVV